MSDPGPSHLLLPQVLPPPRLFPAPQAPWILGFMLKQGSFAALRTGKVVYQSEPIGFGGVWRRWDSPVWGGLGDKELRLTMMISHGQLCADAPIATAPKGFFCCLLSFSPQTLHGQRGLAAARAGTARREVSALSLLVPTTSCQSVG